MAPNVSSVSENPSNRPTEPTENVEEKILRSSMAVQPVKKESKPVELGKYSDAFVPMTVLLLGIVSGHLLTQDLTPDATTVNWLLMDVDWFVCSLSVLYVLLSTVWGPRYMADKEAYSLKSVIIAYNAFQVALSAWMCYEIATSGWFSSHYNWLCQPCEHTDNDRVMRMKSASWFFYMSKILDFLDTFFFVARKKNNQISVLHVVHHSSMVVTMLLGTKYSPGGHPTFMGLLNSGVHTIMYGYYLLSSFGPAIQPYLWWKKYLTTIQLVQFIAIFTHGLQAFLNPSCRATQDFPTTLVFWSCCYAVVFFGLFMDFYKKAYKAKPAKTNNAKVEPTAREVVDNLGSTLRRFPSTSVAHHLSIPESRTLLKTAINAS